MGINPRGGAGNLNTYKGTALPEATTNADSRGYYAIGRKGSGANDGLKYRNGATMIGVSSGASPAALPAIDPAIGGWHNESGFLPQDNGEIAAVLYGDLLTENEAYAEYIAVQAYMTAIGANV